MSAAGYGLLWLILGELQAIQGRKLLANIMYFMAGLNLILGIIGTYFK